MELYDLISDPQEKVDVSAEEPELVERMLADVDAQLARIKQQGGPRYRRKSEIDAETRQRLRELGYAE